MAGGDGSTVSPGEAAPGAGLGSGSGPCAPLLAAAAAARGEGIHPRAAPARTAPQKPMELGKVHGGEAEQQSKTGGG